MNIIDKKQIEGIETVVVQKVDEIKQISENKNKTEKMRLFFDIAKELRDKGYYSDEEFCDCIVGIGSINGFKFENFKN